MKVFGRAAGEEHRFGGFAALVTKRLPAPLVRNAYALVASTLANSGLGVVFWIVAARLFSPATVGTDVSLISAMTFLSILAQLNLGNGFNRFVPTAGHRTTRLVGRGYAISIGLSMLAAIVFIVGIDSWAPRLSFIGHEPISAGWFVLATMIWTIFVLEDAVLTGLGEAHWVLLENAVFGFLKLLVLVVVASHVGRLGVFVSWTMPLLVVVLPVNAYLFRKAFPRRVREEPREHLDARVLARFLGPDFASSLVGTATTSLMPLIVLGIAGSSASAYLYVATTVGYTLYLINLNIGMSLITEASQSPERAIEYTRKALRHGLYIVASLAVVIIVAAPLALRLFGRSYSTHATLLLQLFALSAVPNLVVATYVSIARARRRMRVVVVTVSSTSAAVLVLSVVLLKALGLNGVGVAWLVVQSVAAVVILLGEFRSIWLPAAHRARKSGLVGASNR